MSVITWPSTLRVPAECTISQARYDMLESSDATGHQAARLFGPPRWRMGLRSIDAFTLAEAGQWEALLLKLRGGVNHLAVYDPVRTEPQGTLRGAPVLNATAAAGASSLVLGKCSTPQNMLLTPSFEVDTDANGLADDWAYYTSGSATGAQDGRVAGNGSTWAQRLLVTAMGATSSDVAGFRATNDAAVTAGQTYTLAADVLGASALFQVRVHVDWYDAGLSLLSGSSNAVACPTSWARVSLTATAPANAVWARCFVWIQANTAGPGAYTFDFDNVQFEAGPATAFAAPPTLLAGDWLQVGTPGVATSQLVKVVANATATGNSLMTVTIEPPLRQQFTAAAVVAWDKPLGYFKQVGSPQWGYRPALRMKQTGFALDLLESWTA
jgi:hypothetical protein